MFEYLKLIIDDLNLIARQPKNPQTEENTNQYVDFLFENAKLLPSQSIKLREFLKISLNEVISCSRNDIPSLCMRSRFKVEDILKCVQ
jgi:hypothetical protein